MKNIKFLIIALLTAGLWSCDIEREPFQDLADDVVFGDELGLEAASLGTYAILKQTTFMRPYHFHGEYGGDNISLSGATTDHLYYMYNYQHVPNNYHLNSLWVDSYRGIVNCNKIIEEAERGETPRMDHIIGENYYLRAFFYFTLTNIWGRPYTQDPANNLGVPLKLDAGRDDNPPRATVAENYAQIIEDLEDAAEMMEEYDRPGSEHSNFASQEAAWALLSRIYLYMEENEQAAYYANKVLDSGRHSLLQGNDFAQYPQFVPEENDETIFACRSLEDEDDYSWYAVGGMYATIDGIGWGEMYASQPYRDLLDKHPEDLRQEFIDPQYVGEDADGNPLMWIIYIENKPQPVGSKMFVTYDVFQNEEGNWEYEKDGETHVVQEEVVDGKTQYYIYEDGAQTWVDLERRMETRNGYPLYYVLKCSNQEGQPQLWSPVISRLAEIYLNRAEANAKMGNEQAAIDDVNVIRQRAGIPQFGADIQIPDDKTVLDIVLEERQLELAYESHRRYDIFRNDRTLDRKYPGTHDRGDALMTIPPDHPRVVEYIPEPQLLAQPNLVNNP